MTFALPIKRSKTLSVQPKLKIGQPGDKFEKQADLMADQVMRMPQTGAKIQRKCNDCEKAGDIRMQPIEEEEEMMQPQPMEEEEEMMQPQPMEEEEEMMQPKSNNSSKKDIPDGLSSTLTSTKGSGSPLPENTKNFMSDAFGNDFSNVRIHTGSNAVKMNESINAKAFAHGSDIYFNKGQFQPGSPEGKRLLAHELTHTVQQGNAPAIQRNKKSASKAAAKKKSR